MKSTIANNCIEAKTSFLEKEALSMPQTSLKKFTLNENSELCTKKGFSRSSSEKKNDHLPFYARQSNCGFLMETTWYTQYPVKMYKKAALIFFFFVS